jgi:hypothetical protein
LMSASQQGHAEVVSQLLAVCGINVNAKNKVTATSLFPSRAGSSPSRLVCFAALCMDPRLLLGGETSYEPSAQ